MRHLSLVLLCFSLVYFTASCTKENNTAGDMPLVQRINSANGDSTGSWEFVYDSSQHLQAVKFENNNGHKWILSVAAPENDTAIVTNWYHQPDGYETVSADTLVYRDGKIVQKLQRYFSCKYVYDALGRLIADSTGGWPSRNEYTTAHDFLYDEHSNVVSAHTYFNSAGVNSVSEVMTASYNNNENPYYKPGPFFYILCNSDIALSMHNRTAARYENPGYPLPRIEQYSYAYNSGFLISMTINGAGANTMNYSFYY